MTAPLILAGSYGRTAVGETLEETLVSLSAGVRRVRRIDGDIPTQVAAAVPLDRAVHARTKLLCEGALAGLRPARDQRFGLLLAVDMLAPSLPPADVGPELRAPEWAALVAPLVRLDRERLSAARAFAQDGRFARAVVEASDSTLATRLLTQARDWLESGEVDRCLVGGVSTSCAPAVLDWRTRGPVAKLFGPIAGEAAVFLELARAPEAAPDGLPAIVAHACGMGTRERPLALEEVVEAALAADSDLASSLGRVVLDSNGVVRGKEAWAVASTRTLGRRGLTVPVLEPLLGLGDVGTATLPLLAAYAIHASREDRRANASAGTGARSLVVACHSASPGWAAWLLETPR